MRKNLITALFLCAAVFITNAQFVSGQNLIKYVSDNSVSWGYHKVKWISHRGCGFSAPENTLSAYELSRKKGYKYVECDVRFTRDSVPVLIHDASINRTSDGSGLVKEYSYMQLLKYDFGSWKSSLFISEKIPSFNDFIQLCFKLALHPYIDVKELDEKKALILTYIVNKYQMIDNVTWIGPPSALIYIKNAVPKARLGIITKNLEPDNIDKLINTLNTPENTLFIDAQSGLIDRKLADYCKSKGIELEGWVVYDISEAQRLINIGVTGITADNISPYFYH